MPSTSSGLRCGNIAKTVEMSLNLLIDRDSVQWTRRGRTLRDEAVAYRLGWPMFRARINATSGAIPDLPIPGCSAPPSGRVGCVGDALRASNPPSRRRQSVDPSPVGRSPSGCGRHQPAGCGCRVREYVVWIVADIDAPYARIDECLDDCELEVDLLRVELLQSMPRDVVELDVHVTHTRPGLL